MPRGKIAFDESAVSKGDGAAALTGALTAAAAAALTAAAGDAARVAAIVAAGFAATLAGAAAYDAWSATAERQPQPQPQKAKEPEKACKKTCSEDWKRRNLYYDEVRMGRKKSGKRSWL